MKLVYIACRPWIEKNNHKQTKHSLWKTLYTQCYLTVILLDDSFRDILPSFTVLNWYKCVMCMNGSPFMCDLNICSLSEEFFWCLLFGCKDWAVYEVYIPVWIIKIRLWCDMIIDLMSLLILYHDTVSFSLELVPSVGGLRCQGHKTTLATEVINFHSDHRLLLNFSRHLGVL